MCDILSPKMKSAEVIVERSDIIRELSSRVDPSRFAVSKFSLLWSKDGQR